MAKIHRIAAMGKIISIRLAAKTDESLAEHVREIVDQMLKEEAEFKAAARVEHELNTAFKATKSTPKNT